jgi:sugar phosphate permease
MAGAIIEGLEGARGMRGWRWLLLIEGIITVVCGFCFYFILPDYPQNARLLSDEQRKLAHVRILYDRNLTVTLDSQAMTSWQAFKAVIADVKSWVFLIIYTFIIMTMSISYFIPSMLKNLGYTSVTAQWMTVPIWSVGAVTMVAMTYSSDRTQDRRWHIVALFAGPAIACLVSAFITNAVALYVMMVILVAGIYTALPLVLNWVSEWIAFPTQKRSVAIAFVNSFGHLSLTYGSHLWPSTDGPRHLIGFGTLTALCGAGAILTALVPLIFGLLPKQPATKAEREILAMEGQKGDDLIENDERPNKATEIA